MKPKHRAMLSAVFFVAGFPIGYFFTRDAPTPAERPWLWGLVAAYGLWSMFYGFWCFAGPALAEQYLHKLTTERDKPKSWWWSYFLGWWWFDPRLGVGAGILPPLAGLIFWIMFWGLAIPVSLGAGMVGVAVVAFAEDIGLLRHREGPQESAHSK